ncbi:MAG: hypothetical protein Q8P12_02810 [bacterium]|nr:hypothetical protein [bacterium]
MKYHLCDSQALDSVAWTEASSLDPYPKLVVKYDQWGGPAESSYAVEVSLDPSGAWVASTVRVTHNATGEVAEWGEPLSFFSAPQWVREARDGAMAVLAHEGGMIPEAPASWNEEDEVA